MNVTREEIVCHMRNDHVEDISNILEAFGFKKGTIVNGPALCSPQLNLAKLILINAISLHSRKALSDKMATELIEHFGGTVSALSVIGLVINCLELEDCCFDAEYQDFDTIPDNIRYSISEPGECPEDEVISGIEKLNKNLFIKLLFFVVRKKGSVNKRCILPLLRDIHSRNIVNDGLLFVHILASLPDADTGCRHRPYMQHGSFNETVFSSPGDD